MDLGPDDVVMTVATDSAGMYQTELRFAEDNSRQTIAESLGITEHGAKNLMQRAKSQLRQCVEQKIK